MEKIQTFNEIEESLSLTFSSEAILRDIIDSNEPISLFDNLPSTKHRKALSTTMEDFKKSNIEYNNILQQTILQWNFEKSTDADLIKNILLSIFSGGSEGQKIAKDYAKVLIEISKTQTRKESKFFLERMKHCLLVTMKNLKDKIYEHKDIHPIYKTYCDFIEAKKTISLLNSSIESKLSHNTSASSMSYFDCKGNDDTSHNPNGSNMINFEVNEAFLKTINSLLNELSLLSEVIFDSSNEIALLFQSTFDLLYRENIALIPFNTTEILKEAFSTVIFQDDFIKRILFLMKTKENRTNHSELLREITTFEEKLQPNTKDMSRLLYYLYEDNKVIQAKAKKNEVVDLDDLVNYINNDKTHDTQNNNNNNAEDKRGKKNKKKLGKKMKKQKLDYITNELQGNSNGNSNSNRNSNGNSNGLNDEEISQVDNTEIEEFKLSIQSFSQIKNTFRKIQPKISKDWLNNLIKVEHD